MTDVHAPRVVAIGGGHGLARCLQALRLLEVEPTAVVTAADDGGSSGRLRRDLQIIAPGDMRMALLTIARNRSLAVALGHRFARGQLEGHALGNLLLVALAEQAGGDFLTALDTAAELLDCAGRVLPSTASVVELKARVGGRRVEGQVRVATARGPIERVWLEPGDPPVTPDAAKAVSSADLVVLGPGSLFTSVIANLLVPGLAQSLRETAARVVYVGNVRTQPGETTGLDAQGHVGALLAHAPGLRLDAVVLHTDPAGTRGGSTEEGAGEPLGEDLDVPRACQVLRADVVVREGDGRPGQSHDPQRLARVLAPLLVGREESRA